MIYNFNIGIGWASSGVEYAQAYRANVLRNIIQPAKFIFTELILQDNIQHLTANIGFLDEEIINLYSYFTDTKFHSTTFTVEQLKVLFPGEPDKIQRNGKTLKLEYSKDEFFVTAYMTSETSDFVNRAEYVSRGKLIRKDFFTYTRTFSEYYAPKDNKAKVYQRKFFNEDGSVAYEEVIDGNDSIFYFSDKVLYSKEEFLAYFLQQLNLTSEDIVIIDRAAGIAPAVLRNKKEASVGVVIHAEHFNEEVTTSNNILWNNYYDYQFTNADDIDFYIASTEAQKLILQDQFIKYYDKKPLIYVIPVGSLDQLKHPIDKRKPFSLITASRLATEKHIDWLVHAVVKAQQILPQISFDIYGTGGQNNQLKELIEELDAESYINLKGHHSLSNIYVNYELYLTASTSEGFGLTLMEAAGSGLPLIGFDVRYGNSTFIDDGNNGYLIKLEDKDNIEKLSDDLSEKIIDFYKQDKQVEFQKTSYEIASGFLSDKVEQKWQDLIRGVLNSD